MGQIMGGTERSRRRARLLAGVLAAFLILTAAILARSGAPAFAAHGHKGRHAHKAGATSAGEAQTSESTEAEAGVNLDSILPSTMEQVKALGVHWVRIFVTWTVVEPEPGVI